MNLNLLSTAYAVQGGSRHRSLLQPRARGPTRFESRTPSIGIQFRIHESSFESTNPSSNPRIQVRIHESKFESTNPSSNPRIQVQIHESKFESTNPSSNPRIQVRIHEFSNPISYIVGFFRLVSSSTWKNQLLLL